jgi:hypothetical protein
MSHPPPPKMQRRAPAKDAPDCISSKPQPQNISTHRQILQLETSEIQTRRVSHMFAVSFSMACTIAELAFAGCPR